MGIIEDTFGPGGYFSQDVKDLARQMEKGLAWVEGKNVDQDQTSMQALEVMSEEAKLLYARILAAQSLVDGRLDPREIEYLYVFMSRIGLGAASREEIRQSLQAREVQPLELVSLVEDFVSMNQDNEKEIVVSIIKDMTQVARADGAMMPPEQESIRAVAEAWFGDEAGQVITLAERAIEYDEALLKGEVSISELEEGGKQIASLATAVGVPLAAVYFSGSVVGLSAAGITSGLATLGLGGILGLGAMVTGIGVVILAGAAAYLAVQWALGGRERELEKKREHMIQEVIRQHQRAIEDLAEDISGIALKLGEYVSRSDQNEARLARLKSELSIFNSALAELKQEKENLKATSEQYAT